MPTTPDKSRVYAGFATMEGGMDSGSAPSLIGVNQYALGINVTNRGNYLRTRPPWVRRFLGFTDQTTLTHWNVAGRFQGATFYAASDPAGTGAVLSVGGRLFQITFGNTFLVREITPILQRVITTADFVVPLVNFPVNIQVISVSSISVAQNLTIDGGTYGVQSITPNVDSNGIVIPGGTLSTIYFGGANNATVLAGALIYDFASGEQLVDYALNPANLEFVYLFQAENYVIVLAGQHPTAIFDGASTRLAGPDELPSGVLGAYGWGRIWIALTDRLQFVAGDIVGGPSGTPTLGRRDAILKVTENDYLNEGGTFLVPLQCGQITAMQFLATQDTSLGIGPLLVGTTNAVFSVQAPVDRTTWKNLTYPIQTISLLDYGPEGPNSTIPVNGDMWYRSEDGWRSFQVSRRNFPSPGNTPMSFEATRLIDNDEPSLLFNSTGLYFDNRLLESIQPSRRSNGITHAGLAALNFDEVSTIANKETPSWEAGWTGLNLLQLIKGRVNNVERAFAFALSDDGQIELWELLKEGSYDVVNLPGHITQVPTQSIIETRAEDFARHDERKDLYMATIYLDELVDTVALTIRWRPDQYPNWTLWNTAQICATVSQCNFTSGVTCQVWKPNAPGYAARLAFPQPPEDCNPWNNQPLRQGVRHQFRLEITGQCRIIEIHWHAHVMSEPMEGECPPEVTCTTIPSCELPIYDYAIE